MTVARRLAATLAADIARDKMRVVAVVRRNSQWP